MKDFTTTSFGLLIAYLLPGVVALFCVTAWSEKSSNTVRTVFNAQADVGLVLTAALLALVLGLILNVLRWLFFEMLLCREFKIDKSVFRSLQNEHKLQAFLMVIEETFRYHQFYGIMVILTPLIYLSWLRWFDAAFGHDVLLMTMNAFFLMLELVCALFYVKASRASEASKTKRLGLRDLGMLLGGTVVVIGLHYILLSLYLDNSQRKYALFIVSLGFAIAGIVVGANAIAALERYSERGNSLKET